jgi:hypothetical protein
MRDASKPTIAGPRYNSELCTWFHACHDADFLDGGAFPVQEVDAASSPSDGEVSGSDAERLDCASASDEPGLLLGDAHGDAGLDVDGAAAHRAFRAMGPAGSRLRRRRGLCDVRPRGGLGILCRQARTGGCAAGELQHDEGRPADCDCCDGEVR